MPLGEGIHYIEQLFMTAANQNQSSKIDLSTFRRGLNIDSSFLL